MRILIIGAGGVGVAAAAIARRRDFFEKLVLTDVDHDRAAAAVARLGDPRYAAAALDATNVQAIVDIANIEEADLILNACDPRLNPPIFEAALQAGCTYLDMAATLSYPHPEKPYELTGVKLGDAQFEQAATGRPRAGSR